MRHTRRHARNPRSSERGSLSTGTLVLLGGAAFVLLTTQGRALLSGLGVGTGTGILSSGIPSSLPVGTVRLSNGQYRLPSGQVVGAPLTGYSPVTGSSWAPIVGAVLQSTPSIVGFFRDLFRSTAGGTGTGGATGSPGAGGSASIPGDSGTINPAGYSLTPPGSLTLADGTVLEIGGASPVELSPVTLGTDLTLSSPDWWAGVPAGDATLPTLEFTSTFDPGLDPSGFSFADPSLGFGLGSLPPSSRDPGFVPVAMRDGFRA